MAINEKYSFKDLSGQDFTGIDPSEFNDSEIVGSCFYQENSPFSEIFPIGMTGVVFRRCNLDNCTVPPGNEMVTEGWERCSNKQVHVQNDFRDWEIDESLRAVKPLFDDGGNSDPAKIPDSYTREETVNKLDYDALFDGETPDLTDTWYLEKPTVLDTIAETATVEMDQARYDDMVSSENFYPFSSEPTLVTTKDVPTNNGETTHKVVVTGTITKYIISGEGKVYQGQTGTIDSGVISS